MQQSIYIRISKTGKVEASRKPSQEPLRDSDRKAIPTIFLALNLKIPDEAFKPPNISATISVPIEKIGTSIEVVDPLKVF
jgi:hypothetical protein